jgi:ferrous iron transport protein A
MFKGTFCASSVRLVKNIIFSVEEPGECRVKDSRLGIGAEIAENILVKDIPREDEIRTYVKEMPVGTVGRIVGYEQVMRGYKGKLLSMGLTPGTEFTVVRVAPLGDPIEIVVRGFHLSLRKQEADALVVEEVG